MMDLFQKEIKTIAVERIANTVHGMKNFHYHDSYEIYYLVKGNRNYVIGDDYFSINKGDMVLIKPGVLHKTAGRAYDRILLNFTPKYLNRFFSEEALSVLLRCFDETVISIPSELRPEFLALFEKIMLLLEDGKEEETFIYLTELLNKIYIVSRQAKAGENKKSYDDKTITKILHYINEKYSDIENISQIADEFFITKYHLCRIFKNATNTSIIEYLNRIKIKKACFLLETTDKTITEICVLCGFNSSVYFCKLFKKLMNITPTEYRKSFAKQTK